MKLMTMTSLFLVLVFISGVNGQQDKVNIINNYNIGVKGKLNGQERVNINYKISAKGKLKFIGFVLNKMQTYVCSIL